jgi:hypothetical protein
MTYGARGEPPSGGDTASDGQRATAGNGYGANDATPWPGRRTFNGTRQSATGWPDPPRVHPARRVAGEAEPRGRSWRTYLLAATLVVLVVGSLVGVVLRSGVLVHRSNRAATPPAATTRPTPRPTSSPTPSPTPTVVQQGAGNFAAAQTDGPVLGSAGVLRRFHVEVENGIDENPDEFAKAVDETLGDPRSWIAAGQFRLQRVSPAVAAEFTIYLVSPVKAQVMCAVGGLDVQNYTSCRIPGQVVINDARWRTAVPDYGAPLPVYRAYAINHEVGHQLGHGHEACTGPGQPAPVMQQQTLGLQGCVANSWPFVNGQRYAGQPVP